VTVKPRKYINIHKEPITQNIDFLSLTMIVICSALNVSVDNLKETDEEQQKEENKKGDEDP
jgi:hypothetical protein